MLRVGTFDPITGHAHVEAREYSGVYGEYLCQVAQVMQWPKDGIALDNMIVLL